MAKINVRDRNRNKVDKKPNWEYRFEAAKTDGKRNHISKAGFRTKKEALEAGAKALTEYNNTGIRFDPSEISFNDYIDFWYEQSCVANLKYATLLLRLSVIKNHLKPSFALYKLRSISPTVVQNYVNNICKRGYSYSMVSTIYSTLKAALEYAVHPLQYIKDSPARYIKLPPNFQKGAERDIITKDEFDVMIQNFPFGHRCHIPLLLGWFCGFRISEAFALTWDDIDLEKKTITINKQIVKRFCDAGVKSAIKSQDKKEKRDYYFAEPKYNSNRTVKIGDYLAVVLSAEKSRQENNEAVYGGDYTIQVTTEEKDEKGNTIKRICQVKKKTNANPSRVKMVCILNNGKQTTKNNFRYTVGKSQKALGKPFDFHSLRHTHATLLAENGVNPKAIQQRLGHKNVGTTMQTYVKPTEHLQQDAVDAFERNNIPCSESK